MNTTTCGKKRNQPPKRTRGSTHRNERHGARDLLVARVVFRRRVHPGEKRRHALLLDREPNTGHGRGRIHGGAAAERVGGLSHGAGEVGQW